MEGKIIVLMFIVLVAGLGGGYGISYAVNQFQLLDESKPEFLVTGVSKSNMLTFNVVNVGKHNASNVQLSINEVSLYKRIDNLGCGDIVMVSIQLGRGIPNKMPINITITCEEDVTNTFSVSKF